MAKLSDEPISVSADGYPIRKGKEFYFGEHKVKVVEVLPYDGTQYRRIRVTKAGTVYADELYFLENGRYIGA